MVVSTSRLLCIIYESDLLSERGKKRNFFFFIDISQFTFEKRRLNLMITIISVQVSNSQFSRENFVIIVSIRFNKESDNVMSIKIMICIGKIINLSLCGSRKS